MNQMLKLRGWVLGLMAILMAGAAMPAAGQGPWEVNFQSGDMTSETTLEFDSSANFSAGFYRIDYVSGAGEYHDTKGLYNLGSFFAISDVGGAGEVNEGKVVRAVYKELVSPVAGDAGWPSAAEAQDAAFGTGKTFVVFKHNGGKIGVQNEDTPGEYDNNSDADITFRLTKLEDVKYKLNILIADSASDTTESTDGNSDSSEKACREIVIDTDTTITAQVPGGLKNATVYFKFGNLPEGVSISTDSADVTMNATAAEWDIAKGTQTFTIRAEEGITPSHTLELYCVYGGSSGSKNKADEDGTGGVPNVDVCPDKSCIVAGDCGCSSIEGSESENGCLKFQINLGALGFGDDGGYLLLFARRPTDGLCLPDALQYSLSERLSVVTGFTVDGDKIEPVETSDASWGEAVLSLHTDGYGYDINFYESSSGTLATSPYRTVTVENLNGATSNKELYITETIDLDAASLPKVRMWHFEWTGTGTGETDDGSWVLTEGEVDDTVAGPSDDTILRITERAEVWNGAADEVTETLTIKEADGTAVVSKTEEVWQVFDWGRERISMTHDPDSGNALKEAWTFYDDAANDGDNYMRLESYLSETGYWERYEYDADGNVAKTMRQHEDEALSLATTFATEAADNIVEEYNEDNSVSVTFGGGVKTVRVDKWQIKVEGTVERTWYEVYIDEADSSVSGCTEEWMVRPVDADPENGTTLAAVIEDVLDGTDTTSLITKTWHWEDGAAGIGDNEAYDVRVMQSPDSQYTVYERTIATDERTTVVRRGFSDDTLANILSGAGDIEYGTKTTSVTDARGNMVSTLNEKISESDNSGDWFIVSFVKVGDQAADKDEFGRPLRTEYFFGEDAADEVASAGTGTEAYDTQMAYGCCGGGEQETRTDRAGVVNETFYDVLGRTEKSVRASGSSGEIESLTFYDAAGRATTRGVNSNPSGDDDLDDADDLKTTTEYDVAGRMTSMTDPEGRKSYRTYRRVDTDGTAFSGTVGTDAFYWETRSYGHNDEVPVSVTWTDSHGRTVLAYTGSLTGWDGTSDPTGTETLTEHTRSTSVYDWDNRMTEGRAYFDIASLALDAPGTEGTNYLVTGTTEYDALGRAFRSIDAAGNITETVYEDGTGRSIKTLIGVDVNDLHTVSRVYYNKFVSGNPTGDDRPWPTRVYTVKPGLTAAPDDSDLDDASPTFTDYTYTESVEEYNVDATDDYMTHRYLWSQPEHGPWSRQAYEEQGRLLNSRAYKNGDDSYELTRTGYLYHADSATPDGSNGKLEWTKQFRVTGGSATSNYLETRHLYDDAGRPVKVNNKGRGFTKTEYDVYGRTKRTAFGSYEGTTNNNTNFTDDTLLTESVPTYDKSGRVTGTVTYERAHDATATGLLSAAAADQVRVTYSYTWFDDNGRQTHSATVGTDASYTYNAASPPEPNTSDDVLVGKTEYDDAGRAYLSTDNLGRQNRMFFDDLGRVTHSVENWDGSLTTPDSPGSRDADVNRITKNIYDNSFSGGGGGARIETIAIDPDSDGNTSDNQSTLYIHSGEVNAAKRGYIPVNGRPVAVVMPDALEAPGSETRSGAITKIDNGTSGGDFGFTEYYANGQVERSTDQRGVQKNFFYTDEGWPDYTTVTEATTNTWDSTGDLRTAYTYGDAGETLTVTTYSDAAGTTETSKLTYTYDGFYNRLTEKQDHDPTANSGAGDPKTISWAYDTTLSGSYYANAYRLDKVTYPNGRVIQLNYDGHVVDGYSIDDRIGRPNAIEEDSSGADIVSYTYLGSGRMARKDYTTPDVRLDFIDESGEGSDANDDYEVSLDQFGRPIRHQWETYDGSGDAEDDLVHLAHGYDRNSNRLYDERMVATSYSKVFDRDELDRINDYTQGTIESDQSAIKDNWVTGGAEYELNQLGSVLGVDPADETQAQVQKFEYNDANEPTAIESKGDQQKDSLFYDWFGDSTSASKWELPSGSGDTFSIDGTVSDELRFTVSQDTYDGVQEPEACAILLWKDSADFGKAEFAGNMTPDSGKQVGFVFGYKSPNDYYIAVCQTSNAGYVYRIHKANPTDTVATKTYVGWVGGYNGNARFAPAKLRSVFGGNDIPSGRVGLWTNSANASIEDAQCYADAKAPTWLGRWRYTEAANGSNGNLVNASSDVLHIDHQDTIAKNDHNQYAAALIDGMTVERFQITFSAKFESKYSFAALRFAYQGDDDFHQIGLQAKEWKSVRIDHVTNEHASALSPDNKDWAGIPDIDAGETAWFRYECDGSTITGYCIESGSAPTETQWSAATAFASYSGIADTRGGIGLGTLNVGAVSFDNVTLKSDANNDLTTDGYETLELVETFDNDSSGYKDMAPEHDASGNLTFDGTKHYTYDAYNRLVKVENAFKDPSHTPAGGSAGDLAVGSTISEYAYDGNSRRIRKDTYVGGALDSVEHFYCIGASLVETRNGSDQITQQHVWDSLAGHYIDSLAQVANNTDPGVDDDVDEFLYALQDQQFNVLAIVDGTGEVVERYEYSLYGQRTVMNETFVVLFSSNYAMNCGFQGLYHDTETRLIYNRARMLSPTLARFIQRDPLGYPDGMNTYAAYHVMWGGVDPSGLLSSYIHIVGNTNTTGGIRGSNRLFYEYNYVADPVEWPTPENRHGRAGKETVRNLGAITGIASGYSIRVKLETGRVTKVKGGGLEFRGASRVIPTVSGMDDDRQNSMLETAIHEKPQTLFKKVDQSAADVLFDGVSTRRDDYCIECHYYRKPINFSTIGENMDFTGKTLTSLTDVLIDEIPGESILSGAARLVFGDTVKEGLGEFFGDTYNTTSMELTLVVCADERRYAAAFNLPDGIPGYQGIGHIHNTGPAITVKNDQFFSIPSSDPGGAGTPFHGGVWEHQD